VGSTGPLNEAPIATIGGQSNGYCSAAGTPCSCCTGLGTGSCVDNTGLSFPAGITLDSSGNIYVTNFGGSVTIYPPLGSSTGPLNEAPTLTITGSNTGFSDPDAIILDASNNIWVANYGGGPNFTGSVSRFAPLGSSTGTLNETPSVTIEGQFNSACTGGGVPWSCCTGTGTGTCTDNTGLNVPYGLAFDPSGDLLVTNNGGNSVTIYSPPLVSGDPSPASTITNGVSSPVGITNVNVGGQQLTFVADYTGSVTVYDSSGNLLSTLSGGSTGLQGPAGVVVIPSP